MYSLINPVLHPTEAVQGALLSSRVVMQSELLCSRVSNEATGEFLVLFRTAPRKALNPSGLDFRFFLTGFPGVDCPTRSPQKRNRGRENDVITCLKS